MPAKSVNCCVTSPPYFGLRDYGHAGQIGLEPTPDEFVAAMVEVFREVRRVLVDDGTVWLNLGDSYAGGGGHCPDAPSSATSKSGKYGEALKSGGIKPTAGIKAKDLIGVPWMVAFALRADGWYLRQDIIWSKPNPMPESVKDRCTKAHEYVFLLSKGPRYHFDADAIAEAAAFPEGPGNTKPTKAARSYEAGEDDRLRYSLSLHHVGARETRNKRSVWTVGSEPFKGAHFATFPTALIEPCILAGCPTGGTVLDPFGGAGTTGLVADRHGRNAILIELNPEYAAIAERRIADEQGMFSNVQVAA